MALARPALLVGLLSAAPLLACGGPPPRAPDGTPLAIAPAQREAATPSAPPKQPEELVAWFHVEDPDAIVELAGARPLLALGAADEEIGRWISLFDLGKPVDFVVTTAPPKKAKAADGEPPAGPPKPGLEAAARFRVKDVAKAIEAMKREFDVTVEAGRVRAVKKPKVERHEDEDESASSPAKAEDREEVLCDFGGVLTGAEFAVCGSPHAMTHAGAWLRTGPRPPEAERARSATKATELARLSVYVRPVRPFLASTPKDPSLSPPTSPTEEQSRRALDESLEDLHACTFELAREGDQVTFAMGSRYASQKSALTRGLFQPTSGVVPTDAFLRITEDASGSLFLPGGGPLARLVPWIAREAADDLPSSVRPQVATMLPILTRLFDRPLEAGYGIDAGRVRKAVAGVRAASKDASKANKALDEALAGYEILRLPIEITSAEALARAYVKGETEKEKEKQATQAVPRAKATPATPVTPVTRSAWAIRPAPARLGLPKGAFLMDTTKTEPGDQPPKTTTKSTESTLFVPAAGAGDKTATWVLSCTEDAACAERAKVALAEKPPTRTTRDVLFQRPGLLAAGHLSTLVGAFALHRMTLQLPTSLAPTVPGAGKPAVPASTLAEIEQHLSEPKLLLPFAIAAQPVGEGGLVSFEIRGERAAWKVLGEHASTAATGSFLMLAMLAVALATP